MAQQIQKKGEKLLNYSTSIRHKIGEILNV